MRRATATFQFSRWDEQPFVEDDDRARLTHAAITNDFHGDIEGSGSLEYVMVYRHDGNGWNAADFVGYEHVAGRVGERSGSFVLQHAGTFENGEARCTLTIVPGSGTGDLRGLRGQGGFVARHGTQPTPVTLDYDIE